MEKWKPLFDALAGPAAGCIISLYFGRRLFRHLERSTDKLIDSVLSRVEGIGKAVADMAGEIKAQTPYLQRCAGAHEKTHDYLVENAKSLVRIEAKVDGTKPNGRLPHRAGP